MTPRGHPVLVVPEQLYRQTAPLLSFGEVWVAFFFKIYDRVFVSANDFLTHKLLQRLFLQLRFLRASPSDDEGAFPVPAKKRYTMCSPAHQQRIVFHLPPATRQLLCRKNETGRIVSVGAIQLLQIMISEVAIRFRLPILRPGR